jgi:hypothetical protein
LIIDLTVHDGLLLGLATSRAALNRNRSPAGVASGGRFRFQIVGSAAAARVRFLLAAASCSMTERQHRATSDPIVAPKCSARFDSQSFTSGGILATILTGGLILGSVMCASRFEIRARIHIHKSQQDAAREKSYCRVLSVSA